MSLIIGLGSNLENKEQNLQKAREMLQTHFTLIAQSRIFLSKAEDYLDQDDFLNQVVEFKRPELHPFEIMEILLKIENEMGRKRLIPKGPRIIDLDILFLGTEQFKNSNLEIPHPRLFQRIFVVEPLRDLPYYSVLKNVFTFPSFHSTLSTLN